MLRRTRPTARVLIAALTARRCALSEIRRVWNVPPSVRPTSTHSTPSACRYDRRRQGRTILVDLELDHLDDRISDDRGALQDRPSERIEGDALAGPFCRDQRAASGAGRRRRARVDVLARARVNSEGTLKALVRYAADTDDSPPPGLGDSMPTLARPAGARLGRFADSARARSADSHDRLTLMPHPAKFVVRDDRPGWYSRLARPRTGALRR